MSDRPDPPGARRLLFRILVCAIVFEAVLALGGHGLLEDTLAVGFAQYGMPLGSMCVTANDCASRFCVDGVCCDGACGGGDATDCQACNAAGACTPTASGEVCRAGADDCDAPEMCDGSNPTCPADATEPDGTSCDLGRVCDGTDVCMSGVCVTGTALDCDDSDACTNDICIEPSGCEHDPIPGCGMTDAGGSGGTDAGGSGGTDAGSTTGIDAGTFGEEDGCSCRAVGRGRPAPLGLLGLALAAVAFLVTRRR